MNKILGLLFVLILSARSAQAFEFDMLNLKVPNQQKEGAVVFTINHRFYGEVDDDPLNGANMLLGLKYVLMPKMELEGAYTRYQNEYTLGAGYNLIETQALQGQINAYRFDYDDAALGDRTKNNFYLLSLQAGPFLQNIVPVVNVGYDGYNQRTGYGLGLNAVFNADRTYLKKINIIGEYYPVINAEQGITNPEKTFAFGVKFDTHGHTFVLQAGNNTQIGTRRLMLGAPDNNLHFGFNINRKF